MVPEEMVFLVPFPVDLGMLGRVCDLVGWVSLAKGRYFQHQNYLCKQKGSLDLSRCLN